MSTAIAKTNGPLPLAEMPVTPMALIEKAALDPNFSVDKLKALFELQQQWEADQARKAYNVAMAKFKADPPKINKNKHVSLETSKGTTEYWHATLDHAVDQISAALAAVGIRHRWEMKQDQAVISVTCILSHDLGHSESTVLAGPADQSGGKNAVQAISSTVTYLQRYTLLAATGLAAAGSDDDGAGGKTEKPKMADEEFTSLRDNIDNAETPAELKKFSDIAINAAKDMKDDVSMRLFTLARDKRAIATAQSLEALKEVYFPAYRAADAAGDKEACDQLSAASDARKKVLSGH